MIKHAPALRRSERGGCRVIRPASSAVPPMRRVRRTRLSERRRAAAAEPRPSSRSTSCPGTNNTLFELTFANDADRLDGLHCAAPSPLNGGCIYTPDRRCGQWIAETQPRRRRRCTFARARDRRRWHRRRHVERHLARVQLRRTSTAASTTGRPRAVDRRDHALRLRHARRKRPPRRFVGPEAAGGKCVGCHALSRDGTKMVAAAGGWDVEDSLARRRRHRERVRRRRQGRRSCRGTRTARVRRRVRVHRDVDLQPDDVRRCHGTITGTIDVGATAEHATSHPDWSPRRLAHRVRERRRGLDVRRWREQPALLPAASPWSATAGSAFGEHVTIVPAVGGKNRYYPAFSPDSSLLVFDESTCAAGARRHRAATPTPIRPRRCSSSSPRPVRRPSRCERERARQDGRRYGAHQLVAEVGPVRVPAHRRRRARRRVDDVLVDAQLRPAHAADRYEPRSRRRARSSGWSRSIPTRPPPVRIRASPRSRCRSRTSASSNHIAQWTEEVIELQ